jgi:hypothetical protein
VFVEAVHDGTASAEVLRGFLLGDAEGSPTPR